jgi:hypothetical protein
MTLLSIDIRTLPSTKQVEMQKNFSPAKATVFMLDIGRNLDPIYRRADRSPRGIKERPVLVVEESLDDASRCIPLP